MKFQRNFMFASCYFKFLGLLQLLPSTPHLFPPLCGVSIFILLSHGDIWMNKFDRLREGMCLQVPRIRR